MTSNGAPAPAGLSTSANSDQLQATLPGGASTFSNPLLFNNIFWDNRAGSRAGTTVTGLGLAGDATPIDHWDVGVADGTGQLAPTNSIVQQSPGDHPYTTSASNSSADPSVVSAYDTSVAFNTWRQNPAFVDSTLVAVEAPANMLGDYHLANCPGSPACNLGAASAGGVNAPTTDIDGDGRPALGGFDSGSDEYAGTTPPPPTSDLYFSTLGNTNPPGVSGTADDSDMYRWNGTAFSREWDATTAGVPASADVDGFSRVDSTHFFVSFNTAVTLPGLGTVADEDVVYYDNGVWEPWYDGSANGVGGTVDLAATSVMGSTLYFSTNNTSVPPGAGGTGDPADLYRWNGGSSYTRVFDASTVGLPGGTNVDAAIFVDATHIYLSFSNATTTVPGIGAVQDEDVVYYNSGAWSVYFDGTALGLGTSANLDLDAIAFEASASPPPPPPPPAAPLFAFSTAGNTNPPGAGGGAPDDADLYGWSGSVFTRLFDASAQGLPSAANVDALDYVDATHFYVSFTAANTAVPGLGNVQDEDVVYYNNGSWSVYFNGTAHGLTTAAEDVNAISVAGSTLYFSTLGNTNPPGVSGTADDADVYSWNGTSYARVWDASANGLPSTASVDGLVWVDSTHLYLSFSAATTSVPGIGTVQDEDIVYRNGGAWSTYFDGTANGLTTADEDIDAFDLVVTP